MNSEVKSKISNLMGAVAVMVSVALLTPITPAFAVAVPVSDTLTLLGPTADFVFTVDESEPEGDGNFHAFDLIPLDPNGGGGPTPLIESDGSISDIIGVCASCGLGGGIAIAFLSDTNVPLSAVDLGFFLGSPRTGVPETGPFDATAYLSPVLISEGFTLTFTSDVEAVPEPAALPLFATGLGVMCWFAWRRKRKAALRPVTIGW
jgi:hypothetical protein